jgi:hypothetical protein
MSNLNVASTARILADRLGVPHLVMAIPWDPALAEAAIRSAAWSLSAGGLLAIHVPDERRDSGAPLAEALRQDLADLPLEDVQAVEAADGVAVLLLLNAAPIAPLPALDLTDLAPDAAPVLDALAGDLRADAGRLVLPLLRGPLRRPRDPALDDGAAALLQVRAIVHLGDRYVPTIAGLVAFGERPASWLGGAAVRVGRDGTTARVTAPIPGLSRAVARHLGAGADADLVGAAVDLALVSRYWRDDEDDEPITATRRGDRMVLRWPRAAEPNRLLRRFRKVAGGLSPLALDVEQLVKAIDDRGGRWVDYDDANDVTTVAFDLPGRRVAHPSAPTPNAAGARPALQATAASRPRVAPSTTAALRAPVAVAHPTTGASPVAANTPWTDTLDSRPEGAPALPLAGARAEPSHRDAHEAAPSPLAALLSPPGQEHAPDGRQARPMATDGAFRPSDGTSDARDAAILALARTRGPITTRDVIDTLGWTRSTARDALARLVASGRLRPLAVSARSPHQAYSAA